MKIFYYALLAFIIFDSSNVIASTTQCVLPSETEYWEVSAVPSPDRTNCNIGDQFPSSTAAESSCTKTDVNGCSLDETYDTHTSNPNNHTHNIGGTYLTPLGGNCGNIGSGTVIEVCSEPPTECELSEEPGGNTMMGAWPDPNSPAGIGNPPDLCLQGCTWKPNAVPATTFKVGNDLYIPTDDHVGYTFTNSGDFCETADEAPEQVAPDFKDERFQCFDTQGGKQICVDNQLPAGCISYGPTQETVCPDEVEQGTCIILPNDDYVCNVDLDNPPPSLPDEIQQAIEDGNDQVKLGDTPPTDGNPIGQPNQGGGTITIINEGDTTNNHGGNTGGGEGETAGGGEGNENQQGCDPATDKSCIVKCNPSTDPECGKGCDPTKGEECGISGGGDCETKPTCDGAPVTCFVAEQTWKINCAYETPSESEMQEAFDEQTDGDVVQDLFGDNQATIDVTDFFDLQADGGGSCPADIPITGIGTIPVSTYCSLFELIGTFVLIAAVLLGIFDFSRAF